MPSLGPGEIQTLYSAIQSNGMRQLQSRFYWDGKRIWGWNEHDQRFYDFRRSNARLHFLAAGCRDFEREIQKTKEAFCVSAALPIALHAAGDLVCADRNTILCTEDLLPIPEGESGKFPLISEILESILSEHASTFVQWIARALAYTRGQIPSPPDVPCLIGGCDSAKGLLARLTNLALCGRWSPRRFNLLTERFSRPFPSDFTDLVFLIDLSSCSPNKSTMRKFQKLLSLENSPKRISADVDIKMRQAVMIRCHDSSWPPLEAEIQKCAPNRFTVFRAGKKFSLRDGEERMSTEVLAGKIRSEMPQFRRHLASIASSTCIVR